jgi:1-acyl-sn-glycerol-3-phosphate acyltransferase
MFTDSSAPRDAMRAAWPDAPDPPARRQQAPGVSSATPLHIRVARVARLLVLLGRLWFAARFRVPRLSAAQRTRVMHGWARRVLRALRVDVRARGHVPAAGAPLLVVANHVSWLDSYALHTVSAARFVAKSEVSTWPVIGTIAACFDTIFLKRSCYRAAARTVGTLATGLCAGRPAAVFPEGTTSADGGLLGFYPAMFQAAVLSGARVQPVAIRYRDAGGAPTNAAAFVGEMTILDSLRRLLREPHLTVELIFCAPLDPADRTRRELAALARAAIAAALGLEADTRRLTPVRRAA